MRGVGWGRRKSDFFVKEKRFKCPSEGAQWKWPGLSCGLTRKRRGGEEEKNLCATLRRRRWWRRRKCSLAIKKCKSENKENRACKAKVQNLNSADSDVDWGSGSGSGSYGDSVRNNVENFVVPSCGMPSPPPSPSSAHLQRVNEIKRNERSDWELGNGRESCGEGGTEQSGASRRHRRGSGKG